MEKLGYFTISLIALIIILLYIIWSYWKGLRDTKKSVITNSKLLQSRILTEKENFVKFLNALNSGKNAQFDFYVLDLGNLDGVLRGLNYKFKHNSQGLSLWQSDIKKCEVYFNCLKAFHLYRHNVRDKITAVKNLTFSISLFVSEMTIDEKRYLNSFQSDTIKKAINFVLVSSESKEEDYEKLDLLPQALSLYANLLNLDTFN